MEKNGPSSLLPSIVLGGSLVISAYLLSSGIKEYGVSVERAVPQSASVAIPSTFTLRFESGSSPVRVEHRQRPAPTPSSVSIPDRFTLRFENGDAPLQVELREQP